MTELTKKMRVGTLLCWLFGHKFVSSYFSYRYIVKHNCCVRCGIDKEDKYARAN